MRRQKSQGVGPFFLTKIIFFALLSLSVMTGWAFGMDVNVMPDSIRVAGTNKAYVTPGEEVSVWGNVTGGAAPYSYVWAFGDGSSSSGAVSDPRDIAESHVYAATGSYIARLTVTDSAATVVSASVRIDVVPDDQDRKANRAIQKGLKYLYLNQQVDGSWSGWPAEAYTAGAVQAFEIQGHLPGNDVNQDIYAGAVIAGLNYLFSTAQIMPMSPQPAGNPDSNGDGIGVYWGSGGNYPQYTGGLVMLAVAASNAPDRVATTGPTEVLGQTYREIMQNAVDYMAWAQNEGVCSGGDWYGITGDCGNLYADTSIGYDTFRFYSETYCVATCSEARFFIDYGDGSEVEATTPEYCDEGYGAYTPYPGWTHTYVPGVYDATTYWDNEPYGVFGPEDTEIAKLHVTVVDPGVGSGTPEYGRGGWRYAANEDCSSDNSVTQWPVIGLKALESFVDKDGSGTYTPGDEGWGLFAPDWVKEELALWTNYSQYHNPVDFYDGAFIYSNDSLGYYTTPSCGSGICQLAYLGVSATDSRVQDAVNFLDRNWASDNRGNLYSMYSIAKGARISDPAILSIGSQGNWQDIYDDWLIADQNADGSWNTSWAEVVLGTAWGVEILTQSIAELVPVAVAQVEQAATPPHSPVQFIGGNSFHQDPARAIVAYRWDFDESNGIDMSMPDALGPNPILTAGYPEMGGDYSVTATLEVQDDQGRIDRDNVVITVTSANVPPVANPGGPYSGAAGVPIVLDASASYDPNAEGRPGALINDTTGEYDKIVRYDWDFDGNGTFDFTSTTPSASHVFPSIGTFTVVLKVTDSFGLSSVNTSNVSTVAVSDLWLVEYRFGEPYPGYSTRRGIRTEWKQVKVENRGTGGATNVTARIVNVPPQVTVIQGAVTFGDVGAGESKWSNENMKIQFLLDNLGIIDFSKIYWDVEYTDASGTHRLIRNVPQFP